MSISLNIKAYSSVENKEFKKHLKAVKFCIENELSFPIETSNFFKGKLGGSNLEEIRREFILNYIENGIEVNLPYTSAKYHTEVQIKVSEIPKEADLIIISVD